MTTEHKDANTARSAPPIAGTPARCRAAFWQTALLALCMFTVAYAAWTWLPPAYQQLLTLGSTRALLILTLIPGVIGVLRLLWLLRRALREEAIIAEFDPEPQAAPAAPDSLLGQRQRLMQQLPPEKADARLLDQMLTRTLARRLDTVRWLMSAQILSGFFASLLALGTALLPELSGQTPPQLPQPQAGIASALLCAIAALMGYFVLSYASARVQSCHARLCDAIGLISTVYLLPTVKRPEMRLLSQCTSLIQELQRTAQHLRIGSEQQIARNREFNSILRQYDIQMGNVAHELNAIHSTLQHGFRLSNNQQNNGESTS